MFLYYLLRTVCFWLRSAQAALLCVMRKFPSLMEYEISLSSSQTTATGSCPELFIFTFLHTFKFYLNVYPYLCLGPPSSLSYEVSG